MGKKRNKNIAIYFLFILFQEFMSIRSNQLCLNRQVRVMYFIIESPNIYRLRIKVLNRVKSLKIGVLVVSNLFDDLKRSRKIFFLKQILLVNLELSNTPILISYKFSLLYPFFPPLFRFKFQKTPDSGLKAKRIKIIPVI